MRKEDFEAILAKVRFIMFPTWKVVLRYDRHRPYIQVQDPAGVCTVTGKPLPWHGRKWPLSPHMCEAEVVRTVYKALRTAVEHEFDESFLYKGVAIFDPHRNLDLLVEIASRPNALDVRDTPRPIKRKTHRATRRDRPTAGLAH